MYYREPYLAHYGVKGMKWGVKKARQVVGKSTFRRVKKGADIIKLEKSFGKTQRLYNQTTGGRKMASVVNIGAARNAKRISPSTRNVLDEVRRLKREEQAAAKRLRNALDEVRKSEREAQAAVKRLYNQTSTNRSSRGKTVAAIAGIGAATAYSGKKAYEYGKGYKEAKKKYPNMNSLQAFGYAGTHSSSAQLGVRAGQAINKRRKQRR